MTIQSRRNFLATSANGIGGLALASLLQQDGVLAQDPARDLGPTRRPVGAARPRLGRRCRWHWWRGNCGAIEWSSNVLQRILLDILEFFIDLANFPLNIWIRRHSS